MSIHKLSIYSPIIYCFCLVSLLLLFISCEETGSVVRQNIDEFTIQEQINIGKSMKEAIEEMPSIYPILDKSSHKCAYDRIEVIFNTLLNTSVIHNRKEFNWSIKIIDNNAIKTAFTLPGGHVYIYSGLIKFLQTESQLVAVLGNELAYADNEYTLNSLIEEYGNLILSDLSLGNNISDLTDIIVNLPYIQYEEPVVMKADSVSISLICPFQYDVKSLQNFIQSATIADIEWVFSKNGGNKRLEKIESLTNNCGEDEETFELRYQNFLSDCF